ncbi:MAG: TolC family protein [Holophagaceae bacterium]
MFRSAPSAGRLAVAALIAAPLAAQAPAPSPAHSPTPSQVLAAALEAYVAEVLARHPDLDRAMESVAVENLKIPQARSLEDPVLGLEYSRSPDTQMGVREDMKSRALTVSQVLPWPGKRDRRETIARQAAAGEEAARDRVRLGLRAEAQRAFVGLMLVREQAGLLDLQDRLAAQAEGAVRARFEAGQGSQADLLRAQLERSRLLQRRWTAEAELRARLAAFNALRDQPADLAFETPFTLDALPDPDPAVWADLAEAEAARSPEIAAADAHLIHAQAAIHENRLNLRPDFVVSGGVMRTEGVGSGWKVGLGLSLPVWAGSKQRKAVQQWEAEHRMHLGERRVAALNLSRAQAERRTQAEGIRKVLRLYREGLLTQSRAALDAALLQLESGRAGYLGVLEAVQGYIADRNAMLEAQAQLQASAIAAEELNPGPTPPIPGLVLAGLSGGAAMGAGGGSAAGAAMPKKEAEAAASSAPTTPSLKSM